MPELTDLKLSTIDFLNHPDTWPQWPWCPVKRDWDGMLGCVPWDAPEVHLFNIWDPAAGTTTLIEKLEYESVAALYEAGWRVD